MVHASYRDRKCNCPYWGRVHTHSTNTSTQQITQMHLPSEESMSVPEGETMTYCAKKGIIAAINPVVP